MFSEHQFYIVLESLILEIYKDSSKELTNLNNHFIAKSIFLLSLQKICRKGLKTSKLTYNGGPSEQEKPDVTIADTANEKNLT